MEGDQRSNTEKKLSGLRPFVKGDPRINRKGRPKSFDKLRALAQQMACEIVADGDRTHVQRIMADWRDSSDKDKQRAFIEYAYGKVPSPVEVGGPNGGAIKIETFRYDSAIAGVAPRSMADSDSPGNDENRLHGQTLGEDVDGG